MLRRLLTGKERTGSQVWWRLTPLIPARGETEASGSLRVPGQPGPQSKLYDSHGNRKTPPQCRRRRRGEEGGGGERGKEGRGERKEKKGLEKTDLKQGSVQGLRTYH